MKSLDSITTQIPADKAGAAVSSKRDAKLWEVSKGFESLLMEQLAKAMRKTLSSSEFSEPSPGQRIFTELLDGEYSKMASGTVSGGLAEMIYRQLAAHEGLTVDETPPVSNPLAVSSYARRSYQAARGSGPLNNGFLDGIIQGASERYGVEPALIQSVIRHESGFNPDARSPAGAKGLMQLMDGTARDLGVRDSYDPEQNVMGGARYLAELIERYEGDERLALAAYNAGPATVDRHGGVPPYPETQAYVNSVMATRDRLETPFQEAIMATQTLVKPYADAGALKHLFENLKQQADNFDAYVDSALRLKTALMRHDLAANQALNTEQEKLAAEMERLETLRLGLVRRIVEGLNGAPAPHAPEAVHCTDLYPYLHPEEEAQLAALRETLRAKLEHVKRLHEMNSRLIENDRGVTRAIMSAVAGVEGRRTDAKARRYGAAGRVEGARDQKVRLVNRKA